MVDEDVGRRERDRVLREISYPSQGSLVKSTAQHRRGEKNRRMLTHLPSDFHFNTPTLGALVDAQPDEINTLAYHQCPLC